MSETIKDVAIDVSNDLDILIGQMVQKIESTLSEADK
jgi:hypothetical protein